MLKEPSLVLCADDNEHDIVAIKRVWKKQNILNPLLIVNDGQECLDYLNRPDHKNQLGSPFPGIVLLDINMPKLDGISVLKHIRKNEALQKLPVVMFTTSKTENDRSLSYTFGANAYVIKPFGFQNFAFTIKTIIDFWNIVELPELNDN